MGSQHVTSQINFGDHQRGGQWGAVSVGNASEPRPAHCVFTKGDKKT